MSSSEQLAIARKALEGIASRNGRSSSYQFLVTEAIEALEKMNAAETTGYSPEYLRNYLVTARGRINTPDKWRKGSLGKEPPVCLGEALSMAIVLRGYENDHWAIKHALVKVLGWNDVEELVTFNDARGVYHDQILHVFDRAIQKLDAIILGKIEDSPMEKAMTAFHEKVEVQQTGSITDLDKGIDAAVEVLNKTLSEDKPQEPVRWINDCGKSAVAALRFLMTHDRPIGGEQHYNAIHLDDIAFNLEKMVNKPLYETPQKAVSVISKQTMEDIRGYQTVIDGKTTQLDTLSHEQALLELKKTMDKMDDFLELVGKFSVESTKLTDDYHNGK